jgi:GxxExxY protein
MNDEEKFHPCDEHGTKPDRYILEDETYSIVGAALDVYHRLGIGFAEPVYQEALEIEFGLRNIPFEREKWLQIRYKGHELKKQYKADFLCYGQIIVELKAQTVLSAIDWSQVINYLKAGNLRIGLLFNFGHPRFLEKKRLIV